MLFCWFSIFYVNKQCFLLQVLQFKQLEWLCNTPNSLSLYMLCLYCFTADMMQLQQASAQAEEQADWLFTGPFTRLKCCMWIFCVLNWWMF